MYSFDCSLAFLVALSHAALVVGASNEAVVVFIEETEECSHSIFPRKSGTDVVEFGGKSTVPLQQQKAM